MADWAILEGDCVEQMRVMPKASVDAIVCDPPYGLEFMGKDWDRLGDSGRLTHPGPRERDGSTVFGRQRVAYNGSANARCRRCGRWTYDHPGRKCECPTPDIDRGRQSRVMQRWHEVWAREAYRVLKPGGHLLAFGGTRTYHRLACAVEDAGFEIRDTIAWMYGSGFPKSLDVSKAIDAAAGATREVVGYDESKARPNKENYAKVTGAAGVAAAVGVKDNGATVTAPATPEARQWAGWGTALKPAHEPIVVARKPLVGTVRANVLAHGTGALNVDGCRIDGDMTGANYGGEHQTPLGYGGGAEGYRTVAPTGGRWPANVVLDPEAAALISESRFFYCAKSSSAERNAGLDGFEAVTMQSVAFGEKAHGTLPYTNEPREMKPQPRANVHPTVKPIALMRWLVRLVTSPGGLVLDPFAGSGTTGCAAALEGFRFVGIEREAEYAAIARARIAWWAEHPDGMELVDRLEHEKARKAKADAGQLGLFGA